MHVAFVHPDPDRETALARRMRRAAESLARRGHEVTCLCTRWWDGESGAFERDGVSYRVVSDSRRWFATRLPVAVADRRPDVVHAAGSDPGAALAARLSGTPLLVDWCGEETPRLLDRALHAAEYVCVPSEHVRTKVRERGVDAAVVPSGVPIASIRTVEPAGSAALVWSGRLDEHANLDGLLLAVAEFRHREWRTLVIGDGPRREQYERQARELRIGGRVDFAGKLPREARIARMRGAHAFVHTANRCPFAAELLLALACGCVGIVEYRPDSAAHEPIAGYDRGFGVTDDEGIVGAIEAAGALPRRTYDDRFDRFSEEAVLGSYLARYRDLGRVVR